MQPLIYKQYSHNDKASSEYAMIWILAAITTFFVMRFLWKSYIHRANVLTRQGANMNWIVSGRVKCDTGGYDMLLSRNGHTVRISWRDGNLTMVDPPVVQPFEDFIAIEQWIFRTEEGEKQELDYDPEYEYYETVMGVIKRQEQFGVEDIYSTILTMKATDVAYLQASTSLIRTGYKLGADPFLIGMMHLTAITNALEEGKGHGEVFNLVFA
ncbi:MAG: hypothetical protein WDM70_11405 [Nitrosomonadales bacterium]